MKNKIQERVKKAVAEIATAGYIEYVEKDPLIAERFKALISSSGRRKSITKEKEESFFSFTITADLPEDQKEESASEIQDKSETLQ